MPKTYCVDLRRRVIWFVEKGHSRREAARIFDLSPSFVMILMRRYKATGDLSGQPRGGHATTVCRATWTRWSAGLRRSPA